MALPLDTRTSFIDDSRLIVPIEPIRSNICVGELLGTGRRHLRKPRREVVLGRLELVASIRRATAHALAGLSEHGLPVNRTGRISGRQRRLLLAREALLIFGAAVSLGTCALCVWLLSQPVKPAGRGPGNALLLVPFSAGMFVFLLVKMGKLMRDVIEGRAVSARGPLTLKVRESTWPSLVDSRPPPNVCKYVLKDGTEFGVPMAGSDIVPQTVEGTVYYTPRAKRLLAIEVAR